MGRIRVIESFECRKVLDLSETEMEPTWTNPGILLDTVYRLSVKFYSRYMPRMGVGITAMGVAHRNWPKRELSPAWAFSILNPLWGSVSNCSSYPGLRLTAYPGLLKFNT